ncbi:ABC transporter related protein [Xylanimonas cellulosilytica DSM 15894]|uniref:ABC transporter related protein n=1 Tax=Xylanimonas cellulosilytica (strain DSM 15894 / JCM 12276 / CECT 5975 / KCTC 9989 / LMG 20990 / NBRC 107835 / XIL07) TaxID=446471 RepID=D1C0F5_XYLCX|nr:ABC transporter ATP-binding protein [Xylanimonas cellulosilytica]ACZ32158.1 ABC transporter related protein [Xylanimonas cellulosilytica DSM 15894]
MTADLFAQEAPVDVIDVTPVVELRQVTRQFPGPPVVEALRAVDLQIGRGDYVSIVGPSGSGKSSLLNVLGLLDRPTSGEYLLDGRPAGTASERERSLLRASRIGFVFQSFHLLPQRTVLDNVMLATMYSGVPRGQRRERAVAALDRVGLSHRLGFWPTTLSGGERQRVAVARALVAEPHLLLADEPTGNLDTASSAQVMALFDELHADGVTLAVITHDLAVSARAARRVRIEDGRLEEIA